MIIVRNLSKAWNDGEEVLSKISFQADRGEFIAVLGASGSGKSVLLRCIALREKWSEGQLIVDGKEISTSSIADRMMLRRDWALLEEKPNLHPKKTALKNVFGGRFYQLPLWRKLTRTISTDEHLLAMDYLEKVGLLDRAKLPSEKLSGGEQQRVAIARALAQGAKVILADDPTKGLDPESADRILEDLRTLCNDQGLTVICTMPNIELAARHASRIWGLAEKKIVLDIPARRLTQMEKNKIGLT